MSKTKLILSLSILLLSLSACNPLASTPEPTSTPLLPTITPETTVIVESTSVSTPQDVPLTEAQVERVPVQGAWTALRNGGAVIVDVRSAEEYADSHIKGAISIPLAEIENNPSGLNLNKDQWIITYCT